MRRLLLLTLLASLAAPAASAQAAPNLISVMQDDDLLVYRDDNTRDQALRRMRQLGVDYVRVTVLWEVVARDAKVDARGKKRKNFKPDVPKTYPRKNWDRYDRLVRAAKTLGIGVYFNITGPGPRWAHKTAPRRERRNQRTWMPKEREFFKFAKAVGLRYNGTYRDENDNRALLPKVSFWSIWNEPNQNGWLTPQWYKGIPYAPRMYRSLWRYGRAALDTTGHGGDIVLSGETAPLGSNRKNTRSQLYPKRFIRELFCVTPQNTKYTGSAARRRGCSELAKLGGSFKSQAWAHHPYTKALAPTQRDRNRDSVTMANVSELTALLDTVQATSGIGAPDSSIMTEFGYETDPPDPFSGISPVKQAEYINLGEYMAFKDPRVLGQAQFILRDVAGVRGKKRNSKAFWFTYQSGLFNINGSPKPAATAYQMPLVATGRGVDSVGATTVNFWGGVRFLPFGAQQEVYMQYRPAGGTQFQTTGGPVKLTPAGYFEVGIAQPNPGTWRAAWVNPVTGAPQFSREVTVA